MAHSGDECEGEEGEAGSASLAADGGIAEASLVSSRGPTIGGGECEVGMVLDVYWRADDTVFRGTVDMVEDGQVLVHYPSTRRLIWHDGQDGCSFTLVETEAVRAAAAAEQVDCSIHPLPHPPTNEPTHSQTPAPAQLCEITIADPRLRSQASDDEAPAAEEIISIFHSDEGAKGEGECEVEEDEIVCGGDDDSMDAIAEAARGGGGVGKEGGSRHGIRPPPLDSWFVS